jgi:hypothetical protein
VHAVDLYATILELAGIDLTATMPTTTVLDSRSLLPTLTNTATLNRSVYVEKFGTNTPTADGHALRNGKFKLLQFAGVEEFYDVEADPNESTNLLALGMTAEQQSNYWGLALGLGGYSALTQPVLTNFNKPGDVFTTTVSRNTNLTYSLWHSTSLNALSWAPVTNAIIVTNGAVTVTLSDTNAPLGQNFYRVLVRTP